MKTRMQSCENLVDLNGRVVGAGGAALINEVNRRHDLYAPRVNAAPSVRILYIVPSDVVARPEALAPLNNVAVHLQRWYAEQLGGRSFVLDQPVIEQVATVKTSAWFCETPNGRDRALWFWFNVLAEMHALGKGGINDPNHRWIYYIDAHPARGQMVGAAGGIALLPRGDIDGVLGLSGQPLCRWVGGLGHELGHALGLGHPPGCDTAQGDDLVSPCQSLMYLGYLAYPNTYFTTDHVNQLGQSPFIRNMAFSAPHYDCSKLGAGEVWVPGHAI